MTEPAIPTSLGLLSRCGPSLVTPGFLTGRSSLSDFSTNTLLAVPTPNSSTGASLVPVVRGNHLHATPLSSQTSGDFRRTVSGLFEDGERISKSQGLWDLDSPYSLAETGGDWFIFDLAREEGRRHLCLKSLSGRLFALDWYDDGRIDVEAGWFRGSQSAIKQMMTLGEDDAVLTAEYSIELYNGSAEGLAFFLNLSKPSLPKVVLELGRRIAKSGQYPDLVERKITKKDVQKTGRSYKLDLPEASITLNRDPRGGHLTVALRRPAASSPLMPLAPALQSLWDGAMHQLHSYPY